MRLIFWEAHIKTPKASTVLIIEASRPSTALSRAGRYMEEAKAWQVPRIQRTGLSAIWGHIVLYRVPEEYITKGRKLGAHIWLLGPEPERVD